MEYEASQALHANAPKMRKASPTKGALPAKPMTSAMWAPPEAPLIHILCPQFRHESFAEKS